MSVLANVFPSLECWPMLTFIHIILYWSYLLVIKLLSDEFYEDAIAEVEPVSSDCYLISNHLSGSGADGWCQCRVWASCRTTGTTNFPIKNILMIVISIFSDNSLNLTSIISGRKSNWWQIFLFFCFWGGGWVWWGFWQYSFES